MKNESSRGLPHTNTAQHDPVLPVARRDFLRSVALLLTGGVTWSTLSIPLRAEPATALTALQISKMAFGAMASFSRQGGGALQSMMRYQAAVLNEVVKQLSEIQVTLAELKQAVKDLPQLVREQMILQFKDELIAEIHGAAHNYGIYLAASRGNPHIWQDTQVRVHLADIRNTLAQKRATLRNTQEGIGLDACLVAPLVMAVEVACNARLGMDPFAIRGFVLDTRAWLEQMESDAEGSIPHVRQQAARLHDEAIDSLANNPLAQRLSVNNFRIQGDQKGSATADPCVVFPTAGITTDSRGGIVMNQTAINTKSWLRTWVIRRGKIVSSGNEDLGINLVRYERGSAGYGAYQTPFSVDLRVGEYCFIKRVPSPLSVTAALAAVEDSASPARLDDKYRADMEAALARVNEARATIALCGEALLLIQNTKRQIITYLNFLGG